MSKVHVAPYNHKALETIIIAAKSREVQQLIANALDSTSFELHAVENHSDFHQSFMKYGFRLGILELSFAAENIQHSLSDINQIYPHVGLIVIAENSTEAAASGIEISGCVHHLFLDHPSVEHLRDFILALQRNQQKRIQGPIFSVH